MEADDISRVLITGTGTMGHQIGFHFAACGLEVTFYDLSSKALEGSMKRTERLADRYVKSSRLSREEADASLGRIRTATDPEDAGRDADFVSESVPEDPEIKAGVFSRLNEVCPEHTVFTTNTSTLLPSMFAQSTGRPERFAAFHFHDIRVSRIVDVMPHPGTSAETVSLIKNLAEKCSLIPVVLKKESHGYVFNAMFTEFLKAAQALAANGVAEVEDIDRSWMGVMQTSVGPFGIMDSVGLDTVLKISEYWAEQSGDPQDFANADFIRKYVDKGLLGKKTGRGFYTYPKPEFLKPGFIEKKA